MKFPYRPRIFTVFGANDEVISTYRAQPRGGNPQNLGLREHFCRIHWSNGYDDPRLAFAEKQRIQAWWSLGGLRRLLLGIDAFFARC